MCRLAVALLTLARAVAAADPAGSPDSRAALALCHQAENAPADARAALLDRALALAERAAAADDRDALAHFALFCTVGEKARLGGLSPSGLTAVRRLRREIDRTLALAPDFADALAGKGALLLDTPRLLGGDPAEAEHQLRRALAIDPDYVGARLDLSRALAAQGKAAEARTEAERALAVAQRKGSPDDVEAARKLLARPDG